MFSWLTEGKADREKRARRNLALQTALDSTDALEKAAKGTMNLAQDVTASLQAKIEDYAAQIDQTSRMLNDALILVDSEGRIESFNPAAERMFGYKKRQILGKSITTIFEFAHDIVLDSKFMDGLVEQVNADDSSSLTHHEEFMGVQANGSKIFIDVSASPLKRSGKSVNYIIIIKNVTHRVNNATMIRELAEKNQELLTTIDSSKTGFLIMEERGTDHGIKFVNDGFCKLTGLSRGKLKAMTLRDLLGVDRGYWTVKRTLNEQIEGRHEVQLKVSTDTIWFDVHITPVRRDDGVDRWVLVFYDTTELKRAYVDLHKSEAHFRAFSEASSESMFIYGESLLDWNERLLVLTGYSEEELEKIHPLDFIHPLEREEIRSKILSTDPEVYETLFLTKQGSVKEVAINSRPIEWENAQARIVVARDITEFKDVETQLKASRERYRTVIDNTIDMIVCFDADLKITFTNQTFRDYFDVEVGDLNGVCLLEIIPPEDRENFRSYMSKVQADQEIRRGIHRVTRHGEIRWQDWIDRVIVDDQGSVIEIQSVARDVTHMMPSQ